MRRQLLLAAAFLCAVNLAAPVRNAVAQAVVNPTTVQFIASPDHSSISADGTAVITSYELQFFLVGAVQPFQRAALGKPNPDATNNIFISLASAVVGWPVPGTSYVAAVAAVGPGGVGLSSLSNSFSFTGAGCTFSVSTLAQSVSATGGSQSATVTTGGGCAWSVASNSSWITVSGAQSRTGGGTVNYTVASNSGASRTGSLIVAGQTLTVTQAGACTFSLSQTSLSLATAGGSGSTRVTTTSGCAWTVSSNVGWITVSGSRNRTGTSTVNFTVSANSGSLPRTGTITVAGTAFTVTQSGSSSAPSPPTNLRISPA